MGKPFMDEAVTLLEYVAEYGGVNAAADVLGRSPSGISRQLQRLADDLGTPLLYRIGRRVELTDAGRALVGESAQLHAAAEQARSAVTEAGHSDSTAGTVRIAAHTFGVSSIIAPAMAHWDAQGYSGTWTVQEIEPSRGQHLLAAEEADVVLMPAGSAVPAADHPRFLVQRVVVEPIDFIAARSHWLVDGAVGGGKNPIPLEAAAEEPWIMGARNHVSREEILAACAQAGFTPAVRHEAQDWTAVSALVATGSGVSLLPRMSPTHHNVARLPLQNSAPWRSIVMVLRRGTEHRRLFSATQDALIAAAQESVAML